MKDDACTHMHCDNCNTEWCYCCGLPEDKLDKEDGNIEGEERHILSILEIHSNKEEQFVFKKIDEIASKEELKEIFAKREK